MYMKSLSAIINSHCITHSSFTDDIQLQMSAPIHKISKLLNSNHICIGDIKARVTVNMLKLNDNKTELMLVINNRTKHLLSLPSLITIANAQASFKQSVKNMGYALDCHQTMD